MTVTYTAEVATVRGLGCFLKLLRRWRGSIYKLVWMDLLIFLTIYYGLSCLYRFLLDDVGKEVFENIVKYCKEYSTLIPLSFVLGFYVTVVMTRWWNQYTTIPFPDTLAVFVSATIHGQDERGRVMRRTIMRYVCLCQTMMLTMISPRVKKRFPTLDHFVEAGLLQPSERVILEHLNSKFPIHSKYWLPIVWAASIVTRARKEGRIRDDFAVKTILDELNKFRGKCGLLLSYDTISIPLVYTQVVTLAVYSYFMTTLMGHQWVEGNNYKFDLYFPVFTTLQFFFYVGWLKVAESLINPFGDDDDDFEVNWMIDRNLQISYLIVDEMHHEHPELVKDQYWEQVLPNELPYTTIAQRETQPLPSTANIAVKPSQINLATSTTIPQSSSLKIDDVMQPNDMNSAPFMFSAKPMSRKNTQVSIGNSVPDAISRTNSVASMFKRLLSRENSRPDSGGQELEQILSKSPVLQDSIKKITDEIIEEVDEQSTIQSQKNEFEKRPTVNEIFGPPSPSTPIDVPNSNNHRNVYDPFPTISSSIPTEQTTDNISIGTSDSEKDEFEELRKKREEERLERLRQNLVNPVADENRDNLLSSSCSPKSPFSYN